jgi:hypothetical protein
VQLLVGRHLISVAGTVEELARIPSQTAFPAATATVPTPFGIPSVVVWVGP